MRQSRRIAIGHSIERMWDSRGAVSVYKLWRDTSAPIGRDVVIVMYVDCSEYIDSFARKELRISWNGFRQWFFIYWKQSRILL